MPKTKKTTESTNPNDYFVRLEVAGRVFEAHAGDMVEAFNALAPNVIIKGKSLLTVKQGKRVYAKPLFVIHVRRFILNKVYRQILARNIEINLR